MGLTSTRRRGFGVFARPEDSGSLVPVTPEFMTNADQLPGGTAGKSYFFQFSWVGVPEPFFEVVGYDAGPFSFSARGALYIPTLTAGTYPMEARLRENLGDAAGDIVDTVAWSLVVTEPQNQTNAVINSTTLSAVEYGDSSPDVPLDVSGSEPYVLSLESGALPSGMSLRPGALTRAELLVTFVIGLPDQEGAGVSCTIGVTGATGVKATKVFASGITVNRPPTFVGLTSIPQIPSNTPGAFDLTPFVRAYPAVTGFTADPVLTTLHANLSKSGLTITYGDLTTIAGTQTVPVLFTLDDNGIGTPGTLTSVIQVGTSSVPIPKVLAAYDLSSYSASNGSEITSVPDLAQGTALPLSTALTIAGTTGPAWDSTNEVAQFRTGKSLGVAVDVGQYPFALGINAKFKSTSAAGTREFMRGVNTFAYFDKGVAGGARPAFLSSVAATKEGSRSSDQVAYSPAQAIAAVVVKLGHSTVSADIIASVTVSNGGSPVSLTRKTAAADTTGEFARTYIYFLGAGVPSGALTATVNYTSGITADVFIVVEGYTASNDVEVVNAPTPVQADAANPSIVCDTTAGNRDCLATAMLGSGQGTLASITDGGSQTRQHTFTAGQGPRFDAATRNNRTGNSDPTEFTHTPVGTPRGVFMVTLNTNGTTDHYAATTYGGVTVPRVWQGADNLSTNNRHMSVSFLGSSIPTGPQTASFDWTSATTDDLELLVITVTADGNLEIVNEQLINADAVTNASVVMSHGGRKAQAYGFGFFTHDDVADVVENANMSVNLEADKGVTIWMSHRQTTPTRGDFTFSYTHTSCGVFLKVLSVAEVVGVGEMQFVASRQTTGGTGDFTFSWTIASDDVALCAINMSEIQGAGGAIMSTASNVLGSTAAQSGVVDTQVRQILYVASATTGSYWKNGVKSALTPAGAGNIGLTWKNIIFHGQQCDWDLYKLEIWRGVLSDGDATAMDARLNTDRTPPTPAPPSPPTNIVASPGSGQVNLSWTPAQNAVSVKIERSTTGGGAGFAEIAAGVVNATYQDTGRTNGQIYYYRLRSTGPGGDSAYSGEVNATPQAAPVGVPPNNRVTSVGSGSITQGWDVVAGATYKVYRGTTTGVYSLIASGVTALSYQHLGLTNGTPYFMAVKATIAGVDSAFSAEVNATPSAQSFITKNFALLDGLFTADMPLSQHGGDLLIEASGASIQGRKINSPATGGGSDTNGHMVGGFSFIKPVTKTVPHLGATRKFFEMTIWDSAANTFLYTSNNSVRASIAAGGYDTHVGLGEEWFYAFAFIADTSLTAEQASPLLAGFDHGFLGLHHEAGTGKLTPMSFFLDPVSASALKLRITVRMHPFDNAQPGETQFEEKGAEIGNIIPGKYYECVYRWKLWHANSNGYAQAWLWEDGVPRNAGNPFLNYIGRLGYNPPAGHAFLHQRRIMSHYLWRGKGQFTQISPNNITGIPIGAKGLRYWVRKSLCCAGGTSGGVTVTKDTLLNYLRLVE